MSNDTAAIILALHKLEQELTVLRAERDEYRTRWLQQVDINDRLRARMTQDALSYQMLEAMGRE